VPAPSEDGAPRRPQGRARRATQSCVPRGLGFLRAVFLVVELVEGPFPAEGIGHRFASPGFEWLVGVDGSVLWVDEGGACPVRCPLVPPSRAFQRTVIRGDVEAAVDQIVGARRQDERRRGRADRYRKGCQLEDGDQLDRRAAGPCSPVTVKTSWQGADGIGGFFEKTFVPEACGRFRARCWRTSRSKSRVG
jgi:hypothetical protein